MSEQPKFNVLPMQNLGRLKNQGQTEKQKTKIATFLKITKTYAAQCCNKIV